MRTGCEKYLLSLRFPLIICERELNNWGNKRTWLVDTLVILG